MGYKLWTKQGPLITLREMKSARNILEAIKKHPLIFDGAMGTMIYQRGVFLNVCYDELSLTQPLLIREIHKEYVEAGADVIEANTFGANVMKLAPYGLAEKMADINRAAVKLARDAAGDKLFVGASVGPGLPADKHLNSRNRKAVEAAFTGQIEVLAKEDIDILMLETFQDIPQLLLAASIAGRFKLPVLASFTPPQSMEDDENYLTTSAKQLSDDPNINLIGINCGRGPADLFRPVRIILSAISKPLVVMPNAGGPREVGGRMLYLNSPEYFTEFSKRFIELGARGVGGCCGTTPAHIRMAARAIRTMSGIKEHIAIATSAAEATASAPAAEIVPTAKKSPFGAKLAAGQRVTSVEMLPPGSGAKLPAFIEKCRLIQDAGVDAINLPDGPRATARMSVMAAAVSMQKNLTIEPIPHYCCRDRNLIGMQSDLLGGWAIGLKTWLFITGDPPKLGNYPDATGVYDLDAIGLTRLANNLNHGFDAAGQPTGQCTAMLIGVGANPVAVDMEREIIRYFDKIDAGAEFAITQPIFDSDALLRFVDRVSKHDRTIPIVAGLFPLLSFKNAEFMNKHVPGVVVPDSILKRMECCTTREDGIKMGIEIAREIMERVASSMAGFQASAPLGRADIALAVLK
jgi:methionine synthase / methylenetetrahydrofolate reductase(NADPH)